MYNKPTKIIEKLIVYVPEIGTFEHRTLYLISKRNWIQMPALTSGGLAYFFESYEELTTVSLAAHFDLKSIILACINHFELNFYVVVSNKYIRLSENNRDRRAEIIDELLDSFFLKIEFLVKNYLIEFFLKGKTRSGKAANFGATLIARFESEIDSEIERQLINFINNCIDKIINGDNLSLEEAQFSKKEAEINKEIEKHLVEFAENNLDQNLRNKYEGQLKTKNTSQIIEYNTLMQQYLSLQLAKTLEVLSSNVYTKLVSCHSKASVQVVWPQKPLVRKWLNIEDAIHPTHDIDAEMDEKDEIMVPAELREKNRAVPEPIEIFTSYYPSRATVDLSVITSCEQLSDLTMFFKQHSQFKYNSLLDGVTCDYPNDKARFSLKYNFISYFNNVRVNLVTAGKELKWQKSLNSLYKAANWLEREMWDLFGVYFKYHPDLRRIFTDYGFLGHPLRKDFPVHGFVDVRYCEIVKAILYLPTKLMAAFKQQDCLINRALW